MAKKKIGDKIIIDFVGKKKDSYLLGTALSLSDELGYDGEVICNEMRSGTSENLIKVFNKYFGDHVILKDD